jgi:L-ascorbate metabolism protein UlaG (beta-lactamase superfamily)
MLRARRTPWPRTVELRPQVPTRRQRDNEIVITFIGHSTFLIQSADGNILTDPIYSRRAGPFGLLGPERARAPGVRFDDLPQIAVVLVSHSHYDHCDLNTITSLERRFSPLFITPLGNGRVVRRAGGRKVEELDWWDRSTLAQMSVMLTPAHHFAARTPLDRNRSLWGGFLLSTGGRTIYFAADTGYAPHFSDIRERAGAVDLALLPIGAYEPRWFMKPLHMNPGEAVRAHMDLAARQSIGCHFGTFQLTTEGMDEPLMDLKAALQSAGVPREEFRTLEFGESFTLAWPSG